MNDHDQQGPTNATAFDVTEHVSKTPNLTPVVRKEVMVDPPTSRELSYECISEAPVRHIRKRKREGGNHLVFLSQVLDFFDSDIVPRLLWIQDIVSGYAACAVCSIREVK